MLLTHDVSTILRRDAIPMVLAMVAMGLVGVADAYFVGQLGVTELASLGFSLPVFYLTGALWVGFCQGATSAISRSLGEKNLHLARRLGVDALLLALLLLAVLVPALLALKPLLLRLLDVPTEMTASVAQFIDVMAFGMPVIALLVTSSSLLRGHGKTRASGRLLLLASLVNVLLDPFLILGFGPLHGAGVAGAALGAIIGYLIACLPAAVALWRGELIGWRAPDDVRFSERARSILAVGIPGMIAQIVRPCALIGLTAIAARFGDAVVAAFAAGSNLQRLVLNGYLGLASALTPLVGHNWGARQHGRVSEGIRLSIRWTLATSTVIWLMLALGAGPVSGGFTSDLPSQRILQQLLWTVPLGYGATGATLMAIHALNAVGRGKDALALAILQNVAVGLPLAALGAYAFGVPGFFVGMVASQVLVAGLGQAWLLRLGLVRTLSLDTNRVPSALEALSREASHAVSVGATSEGTGLRSRASAPSTREQRS